MYNKKTQPTARQRRLHAAMRELGCIVTNKQDVQLHHCVGSSKKHNKVWVGQDFVIPLCWELHDVHSNHKFNITNHKRAFISEYGTEFELFKKALGMIDSGLISDNVFNAIADLSVVHEDTTDEWLGKL